MGMTQTADFGTVAVSRVGAECFEISWHCVPAGAARVVVACLENGVSSAVDSGANKALMAVPPGCLRPVFTLCADNSTVTYVAERRLPLEAVPNLRDLGGYRSRYGGQVRWGRLFRSGRLSALSDSDKRYLHTLGIRTIVDFRRPTEVSQSPTRLHTDHDHQIKHVAISPGDQSELVKSIRAGNVTAELMAQGMSALYSDLALHQREQYATLLHTLAAGTPPLLFHCSAGKDRTGVAAALILMILGVPRDTIMQDYLLTNQFYPPPGEMEQMRHRFGLAHIATDVVKPVFSAREQFLERFFQTIDQHFTSEADYFEQCLGLDAAGQQRIRDYYLY